MLVGVIALIVICYAFMCGLTYSKFESYYDDNGFYDSELGGFLSCLFWPLVSIVVFGMALGKSKFDSETSILTFKGRAERRRQSRLAEAQHRVEVAKLIEEENRILDKQLQSNRTR